MRVTVLYFAAARERAGISSEPLDLPEGATAAHALELACEKHPALVPLAERLRIAVDEDFCAPDRKLREGAQVALIPPVSGGTGAHAVTGDPLSADPPVPAVAGTDWGARGPFVGTVRPSHHGKAGVPPPVRALPRAVPRRLVHLAPAGRDGPGARPR